MSCNPEKVTGYVDGELEPLAHAEMESHLASCEACSDQAAFERRLREGLRALAGPEPSPGLEEDLRASLARARPSPWRVLLPLAAALAAMALWGAGTPRFVAWELSRDHDHCFEAKQLPAEVWGGHASVVTSWLAQRGAQLPPVPDSAGGLELVGARRCPLADRKVAHLYYAAGDRRLSLFVLPGSVRFDQSYGAVARGKTVRLLRVAGTTVGLVGENAEDVAAFERAFTTTSAWSGGDERLPKV